MWNNTPEKFEVVATDGGRLAVASHAALPGSNEFKIIIPTKILNEVCRYIAIAKPGKDDMIEVNVASNQVSFMMKETTFISRLIEGNLGLLLNLNWKISIWRFPPTPRKWILRTNYP